MIQTFERRWDGESLLVAALAACLSIIAFLFCMHRGYVLLFGDAVAHINIARRIFDSRTPGLLQLGTVWLPLPHLLIAPFIASMAAWRSGAGGSIPSIVSYVLACVGLFRLVRGALAGNGQSDLAGKVTAWLAVSTFALNPNFLYMQSTAMTEPIYLALFIWSIVFFCEFVQAARASDQIAGSKSLLKSGVCVAAAELTRYDGWFLAATLAVIVLILRFGPRHLRGGSARIQVPLLKFLVIVSAVPVLWLAYNAVIYRNPLEFANGPYSARAIERKTSVPGSPPHPGANNLLLASEYVVKAGESNLAEGGLQKVWVIASIAGTLLTLALGTRLRPLLLLWIPLPFYALSVAYGSVPIFLPDWWPFSYYNVRYGLQLLPAAVVFTALISHYLGSLVPSRVAQILVCAGIAVFIAASYYSVAKASPVSFREAWFNGRIRIALEKGIATQLRQLPASATILMYLGEHVGALQDAGIPLRRTINEADHRTWRQPFDPQGLWESALANPSAYADYVVAIGSDPVAVAIQPQQLHTIAIIDVRGQPRATIYRTDKHPSPQNQR